MSEVATARAEIRVGIQKSPEGIHSEPRIENPKQQIGKIGKRDAVEIVQGEKLDQQELVGQSMTILPERTRRLEIREFSKSTEKGREARSETAQEIFKQRRNQLLTQKKIETVSQERKKTIDRSKAFETEQLSEEERILVLQAELRDRFSSWIHRIKEKLRPSSFLPKELLESEILRRQSRLSEIQAEKTRFETKNLPLYLKRFDEELRLLTEQRETLRSKSKDTLRLFYEKFGNVLQVKKDSERALADLEIYRRREGTVQSFAGRFNTYFVHAFSLYPGGRNNEIFAGKYNATWKEKLFVEVAERPAISASTISGDYTRDLWSPIGIFLGSGIVVDADYQDMATRVNNVGKKESKHDQPKNIRQYEEKIKRAITGRELQFGNEFRQWNEVILDDNPKPVGFFINLDQKSYGQGFDQLSVGTLSFSEQGIHLNSVYSSDKAAHPELKRDLYFAEIFDTANFVGLKVFAIKDGVAHETVLDSSGRLILGRSVSPQEMVAMKAEIPQENLPKVKNVVSQFLVSNGRSMTSAII